MDFVDPLYGFLLEFFRGGGEIRIFVAEQLIGDLAGQEHPDVGGLMDGLADQVHADGGPDGGDVVGAKGLDDLREGMENLLFCDDDLRVIASDVVSHFFGVFQVDGVFAHADGKGADGLPKKPGGDCAHQGGIQPAA